MKIIGLLSVIITGSLLIFAVGDFPAWGDAQSRPNSYLSPHFVQHAYEETATPNMVTAVLGDYRSLDTLFEVAVVFSAGTAIIAVLRNSRRRTKSEPEAGPSSPIPGLIVQCACRMLLPIIQLFALYVIAHGHYSPGGGFQGGVILAAGFILFSLAFDLKSGLRRFPEKIANGFTALGVLLFTAVGAACMALGGNFLDYSTLHHLLPFTDEVAARSHGILLVEIGVAITVMSVLFLIYANLSSRGDLEEGV